MNAPPYINVSVVVKGVGMAYVYSLAFALLPCVCVADYNNEYFRSCHPAACAVDGVCYCSDKADGWYDGGAGYGKDSRYSDQSLCYKAGRGDCRCPDCGQLFFPNVQCQDRRCDDVTDFTASGQGEDRGKQCYRMDPVAGKVYTEKRWYFDCYTQYNQCDASKCSHGQTLKGCMRVSPGECQSCGSLPSGYYWTTRGGCETAQCDVVQPGWYMTSQCGNTTNTAKVHCSEHIENPLARAFPNPVAQYYCPGGARPPVRVPAFGIVNAEYTDFNCTDGYFKQGTECRACLPGSACLYDKSYLCKANYYSDKYAQSSCRKCLGSCSYANELPMRCAEGSIQNSRCVTCGACGQWPATGINCVRDQVEFSGLPDLCTPRNVVSSVAVCKESPAV